MEIWKNINEHYRVSNIGNIESFKYGEWKPMKKNITGNGYHSIGISKNNSVKKEYVHRLVALCFIPNPENKPQVNHINGIKTDNRVDNLEWVTQSQNNKHSYDIGIKKPTNQKGFKNGNSRLTDCEVKEIRNLWENGNITKLKLAEIYKVSDAHICRIINKKMRTDIL